MFEKIRKILSNNSDELGFLFIAIAAIGFTSTELITGDQFMKLALMAFSYYFGTKANKFK